MGNYCLMGIEFQIYKMKRVEIEGGDGSLKMVTMVNFILCIFYHNKKVKKKDPRPILNTN